ncbi:MAG: DUF3332 family protein [Kofleriaceae bacterium]
MRRTLATTALALALASSSAGCYGTYQATKKVNAWNGQATNSKVANSLIHFGFWVLPVYPICLVADFLIFNNVEFLTGSNPLR